jgi:hypothetical protein
MFSSDVLSPDCMYAETASLGGESNMELPGDAAMYLGLDSARDMAVGETVVPPEVGKRRAPEIDLPFPAVVRGLDVRESTFEEETVLERLSAHRLSLRLSRPVTPGTQLSVLARLSLNSEFGVLAPRVVVHATVLAVECFSDREWRLTMEFSRHRFLYAG